MLTESRSQLSPTHHKVNGINNAIGEYMKHVIVHICLDIFIYLTHFMLVFSLNKTALIL